MLTYIYGPEYYRRRSKSLCTVKFCKGKCRKSRARCPKHESQYQKETNPTGYFHNLMRTNAKRRNVPFTLTLSEFRAFCNKTGYLRLKGRGVGFASIDRINPEEGYHKDNIQIVEFGDNVRKRYVDYYNNLPAEHPDKPDAITIDEMYGYLYAFGNEVQHAPIDTPPHFNYPAF